MYKVTRERLLNGLVVFREGEIVYDLVEDDFGVAAHESQVVGVHHVSVTRREDGFYPSFTIPMKDLECI